MRITTLYMSFVFLFSVFFVPLSFTAVAAGASNDVFGNTCDRPEAKSSPVCKVQDEEDAKLGQDPNYGGPIVGDGGLFNRIANIVALVAGALAVIIIIIGGLKYVTANGDSNSINSAKNMIIGAILGLIIIVLARGIIYFVIGRL